MITSELSNDGLIQTLTALAVKIDLLDMDLADTGATNGLASSFFAFREMALARMKKGGLSPLLNDRLLEELMELAIKLSQECPEILTPKYMSFKREVLRRMGQIELVTIQILRR